MKKLLIAVAIAAASVTPQAFAQAKNFEGFSLLGGLNLVNSTSEVTSTTLNGSVSESSQNLGIQAQYNFALGESFVLGLGANVGLGDLKAGVFTVGASTITVTQKSSSSIYVAPGFAVSPTLLVYGKLAALNGKVEAVGNSVVNQDLSGVGYGLGVQNYFNKNLFVQVEVMQNNYNDRNFTANNETDKSKSTAVSFGIGYKF